MTDYRKPHQFDGKEVDWQRNEMLCECGLPEDNPLHIGIKPDPKNNMAFHFSDAEHRYMIGIDVGQKQGDNTVMAIFSHEKDDTLKLIKMVDLTKEAK